MNNLKEESFEKELLNNIEKKYIIQEKIKEEKKVYIKEYISNDDFIDKHFDISIDELKKKNSKKIKNYLYNEEFGEYSLSSFENNKTFPKQTYISKYLIENEYIKSIEPINDDLDISDNFQFRIFKYLNVYRDIYLNSSNLELRQKVMNIYLLHILNHVMKRKEEIEVNDRVEKILIRRDDDNLSYNQKLKNEFFIDENETCIQNYSNDIIISSDYYSQYNKKLNLSHLDKTDIKDQGFTTPRVLILLPYKKHARVLMDQMFSMIGGWKEVTNKKKFKEEYNEEESNNDCFRLGIKYDFFENKFNLFHPFDESDIILASPLGLKLADKVYDFLSSIEILLLDFSEIFIYQNIEHLEEIFSFLNKPPKKNQNIVSINRIKDNIKDNTLSNLRQSIIISHFKSLDIDLIVKRFCNNIEGIYTFNENYNNLLHNLNQNNIKLEFKFLKSPNEDLYEFKFNYFTKNLWQNLYDTFERHTIIFVSSTFDFIRLKAFFKKNSVSVIFISEETDKKDWQRNRLFFEEGKYKFMLYSERAHFYKKINIRFAKNIFFYSLPEDRNIYDEMINIINPDHYKESLQKYKIEDKNSISDNYSAVISLITKIERYNVEKILGNAVTNHIFLNNLDNYMINY